MNDAIETMAEEFKLAYPLTYDAIYNKGRAEAIEECIIAIEDSKSLFDNSTKWTMAEKDKLQNILEKLKEQKNDK